jgi:U3 small nucleolar RNA-associated protein 15
MAAAVRPLQPFKVAAGPSALTPEQTYWKTFKNPLLIPSPSNNPINHISQPSAPSNPTIPPSDSFVVTTGARVQIYDARTRKLLKTITRFDDVAHGADIRYDGRVLVAGDETGAIQVFDVNSRAILKTWKEHQQPVWSTKFSPVESTSLVSMSDDSTVRLWDLPSQESVTTFRGHTDYVRSGGYMPGQSSSLLVSGSYDQTVRLWDPRAPAKAVITFKHAAAVEVVIPMPSGTTLLAAAGNQITVLDIIAGKPHHVIKNHQKTVTALSLASNNTRLISGALDGHVKIFETSAWNVVAGSKYSSPILSLSIIAAGVSREDKHLAVGLQSGILSIKTRLSGAQKVRERERQKEMQALIEGRIEEHDRKKAKKRGKGWEKRLRGRKFMGEGADIVIEGNEQHRPKSLSGWERSLHKGHYQRALDQVFTDSKGRNSVGIMTLLTALRHRSALRFALSDRDEESIQPILKWTIRYVGNPRTVELAVEVGMHILDLYSAELGQSKNFDELVERLHTKVREEVERSQQAWQTRGMLGMLTGGGD